MNGDEMKGEIIEENKLSRKRNNAFNQGLKQNQTMHKELKKSKQSELKVI